MILGQLRMGARQAKNAPLHPVHLLDTHIICRKKVLMNLRKLKKFHEQLFRVNRGLDQEADMAPRNEDMVEVIFLS